MTIVYESHCPICKRKIYRPIWLPKKYDAYCKKCGRAFVSNEILWKQEKPKTRRQSKSS